MYHIVLETERESEKYLFPLLSYLMSSFFSSLGFLEGLPQWNPECGGVQEDLCQLLPLRRRLQVRRARLPYIWHKRRRHHRLQGVHHRPECDIPRRAGAETALGLQHVRPGRERIHQPGRDAGDSSGEDVQLFLNNIECLLSSNHWG